MSAAGYRKAILNEKFILLLFWIVYLADYFYKHHFDTWKLWVHFVFTLNYVVLIAFINYFLLPKFFYKRKHLQFFLFTFLAFFATSFIEENVLENIVFPATCGCGPPSFMGTLREIGDFFLYIFLGVGFKIAWDALERQKAYELVKKEKLEAELKFLKFQVSPHMLFNSLNSIYSFALHSSPKTPEMILKLSDIMRYLLYESADELVSLSKELQVLKDYVYLQELAMEQRGSVRFVQKGVADGYFIAPLILLSFVENCFKHSMDSQINNIEINIYSEVQDGAFTFRTENTFSPAKNEPPGLGGVGLQNARRRLELLYPSKYTLRTEVLDKLYKLELTINLV
ncbi:MAG TPA: histidine kinase [Chitinophagaceae bacterium]|nr:histidine kinase [Chitinophagaceae bacterium]